jgi:hypothetical protein
MHKKISITMALTIATILTTYIVANTLSNEAFAQSGMQIFAHTGQTGQVLAGHNGQALTKVITGVSHLAGLGFSIGAILKFKQHKDNPIQTHTSQPIHIP